MTPLIGTITFPIVREEEPEIREAREFAQGHTAHGKAGPRPQQATLVHGSSLPRDTHGAGRSLEEGTVPSGSTASLFPSPGPGSLSSSCGHLLVIFTEHYTGAAGSSQHVLSGHKNV